MSDCFFDQSACSYRGFNFISSCRSLWDRLQPGILWKSENHSKLFHYDLNPAQEDPCSPHTYNLKVQLHQTSLWDWCIMEITPNATSCNHWSQSWNAKLGSTWSWLHKMEPILAPHLTLKSYFDSKLFQNQINSCLSNICANLFS